MCTTIPPSAEGTRTPQPQAPASGHAPLGRELHGRQGAQRQVRRPGARAPLARTRITASPKGRAARPTWDCRARRARVPGQLERDRVYAPLARPAHSSHCGRGAAGSPRWGVRTRRTGPGVWGGLLGGGGSLSRSAAREPRNRSSHPALPGRQTAPGAPPSLQRFHVGPRPGPRCPMTQGSRVGAVDPMFLAVWGQRCEPEAPASMAQREAPLSPPHAGPRGDPLPSWTAETLPPALAGAETRGSLWGAAPVPAFTSRPECPAPPPGPQAPSSSRLHPLPPGVRVRLLPP